MWLRFWLGKVEVAFHFCFFIVVLLFALLGKEVLALYIALPILTHELGHLVVLPLCGVRVQQVLFTSVSVEIGRSGDVGAFKEACISLGGIVANLLTAGTLYLFAFQSMRIMFLIAANVAVAIFNLLPIGDLDGGQVVRQICGHFLLPHIAENISRIVSLLVLAPLFGVSIWLIVSKGSNFTLLLTCVYLAFAVIHRD